MANGALSLGHNDFDETRRRELSNRIPRETTAPTRQGLIERIPLETAAPQQRATALPQPAARTADNYTNSPERSAWQQQMLARQPNRVDPLEWQARTRAEALAAPRGEVFRPGGTVSTLSGPSTDELLARADRIRAIRESSTPLRDELAFNAGAVGGRQYSQDERIQGLLAGPSRSGRAEALRFLGQREAGAGETARERARAESLSALESARGENQLASTRLQGENALAAARLSAETGAPLREAQAELARVQARAAEAGIDRVNPLAPPTIDPKVMESLAATDPAAAREYYESQVSMQQQRQLALRTLNVARADGLTREQILSDPRLAAAYSLVYEPQRFAEGGLVRGIGQTPDAAQVMPEVTEYRDYTQGAQALGLPAIPFEQFLTLRRGAKQVAQAPGPVQPFSAMGFAMGGEIPSPNDVSGKMVLDLNPSAQTDSIPAMIDGQMPAALDHGEFVFPRFAVQFYGTDRINKMIEAAKQGSAKTQE